MSQRSGIPPWHMWGNSQPIVATLQDSAAPNRGSTPGQLVRINYLRPETWHWLFAAKLVDGPNSDPAASCQVEVSFDLTVGIGRAAVIIDSGGGPVGLGAQGGKTFETFFFEWGNGPAKLFPNGVNLWSTEVLGPNRSYKSNPPFPNQDGFPTPGDFITGPSRIDQIVAQDIQVNCRVIALAIGPGSSNIGQQVTVEVSALFAPKTHVRPEWFKGGRYPGAEDGGGEQGSVAGQMDQLNKPAPGSAEADEAQAFAEYYASLSPEQLAAEERQEYADEVAELSQDPVIDRLRPSRRSNPRRLG